MNILKHCLPSQKLYFSDRVIIFRFYVLLIIITQCSVQAGTCRMIALIAFKLGLFRSKHIFEALCVWVQA